ncbi:MAG: DHHA1 domain-containing protein [Candidatus Hodarchaeota archaeon]
MVFLTIDKFANTLLSDLREGQIREPKVMLVADNDLDGICSASLLDTALYELNIEDLEVAFRDPLTWDVPYDNVEEYDPDVVILLDIASGSVGEPKSLARLAPRVYQIDHHITKEIGHPKRLLAYNPTRSGEYYIPTVYLTRELCLQLKVESMLSENANLVTLIGLFADAAISYYREVDSALKYYVEPQISEFYEHCKLQNPSYFQIKTQNNFEFPLLQQATLCLFLFNRDLGQDEGYVQLVNAMEQKNQVDALVQKIILKYEGEFSTLLDKIQRILNYFEHETDLAIIQYNNREREISNSTLSRLLVEHTGKPVVVHSSTTREVFISARLPKTLKMNLVTIFEKYGGGGHQKACGGRIRQEDLPLLIQDIEDQLP